MSVSKNQGGVIGKKTDTHSGDSLYSLAKKTDEHDHNPQKVYPTGAAGVTVTAGTPAWTLGSFAEIVPASTITSDFDVHWITIEAVSAAGVYELVLYAATTEIGRLRFTVTGTPANRISLPQKMQTAIIAANTQIQAKLMTSTGVADTTTISIEYHTY
jgi:hypothetical protein